MLGDIIDECYTWEILNPKGDTTKVDAIIDEGIASFDVLIEKVNAKKVENKKAHFKAVTAELVETANQLLAKINKL